MIELHACLGHSPARAASGARRFLPARSLFVAVWTRSAIPDRTRGRREEPDAGARRQIPQAMTPTLMRRRRECTWEAGYRTG